MDWKWPWSRGNRARLERKDAYGFVTLQTQGEARWTRRDYASLARAGFMGNPVAHRAVRMICEAVAAVPLLAFEGEAELNAHPLLDLLARPNPRQAGGTFFEALYGHLLLSGNAYLELIEVGPQARELHLLRPDRVMVISDSSGWPTALEHREGAKKRRVSLGLDPGGGAVHLSLFHPLDDHYGFAPLEAALVALDTHAAAARWNKGLLDNSARPSGALVYAPKDGGNLSGEQFDRLKTELEEGYSGPARAGRPLLLEGGLDWKPMSLTPHDMDFIAGKHAAAREIALAFGVPPQLLGIPGDATYANYREANAAFWRGTVIPLVRKAAGAMTGWLGSRFSDCRIEPDLDAVPALQVERDALWARLNAAGFLTEDERRRMAGVEGSGV